MIFLTSFIFKFLMSTAFISNKVLNRYFLIETTLLTLSKFFGPSQSSLGTVTLFFSTFTFLIKNTTNPLKHDFQLNSHFSGKCLWHSFFLSKASGSMLCFMVLVKHCSKLILLWFTKFNFAFDEIAD